LLKHVSLPLVHASPTRFPWLPLPGPVAPAAAAKALKGAEAQLRGTVRLLFQPAEEGGGGAAVMEREGALEGAAAVFGLHVDPHAPSGTVRARVGAGSLRHAATSRRTAAAAQAAVKGAGTWPAMSAHRVWRPASALLSPLVGYRQSTG
jgi:IAA-amino acid hydrolase